MKFCILILVFTNRCILSKQSAKQFIPDKASNHFLLVQTIQSGSMAAWNSIIINFDVTHCIYSNCVMHICVYIIVTLYSLRLLHWYQNRVSISHSELIPKNGVTVTLSFYSETSYTTECKSILWLNFIQAIITLTMSIWQATQPNQTTLKGKPNPLADFVWRSYSISCD